MKPGDKIRLTAKHLRSTGQVTGHAGLDRWIVVDCSCGLCSRGQFVAVNEPNLDNDGPRHFARGNVQKCK